MFYCKWFSGFREDLKLICFPPEGPILNCPAMGSIFNFRSMLKSKLCKEPPYDTFMHNWSSIKFVDF